METGDQLGKTKLKKLGELIELRVPNFKIRYKRDCWWHRLIGLLFVFNRQYMTDYVTTLGSTVWLPSKKFDDNSLFRILCHEYVHLFDWQKHKIAFPLLYIFPQILALLSLVSVLAIWFSSWWLVSLLFMLCVLPLPAPGRAVLEERGYAMNLALRIWQDGDVDDEDKLDISDSFLGWEYYKMWPFERDVSTWIEDTISRVRAIDSVKTKDNILNDSIVYGDVYSIVTGIEFDSDDED